ncbi:MAG TPA: hypothetical protein VGR20_14840 [Acidimicrobiia bacterium]|jgi:hypothetical protein|nr:hypothetical protein [Acidimicrobiia bacterium]
MRHTTIWTPAYLEEAYPFADGESSEAAIARHGDAPGPRSLLKAPRPDYSPETSGPKGTSLAY